MSFMRDIEKVIKSQNAAWLEQLMFYHAIEVHTYKVKKDEFSRVYGHVSGALQDRMVKIRAIIVNNDVIPIDDIHAGSFSNGMLYTTHPEKFEPGMVVEIPGDSETGLRVRRFEIVEKQAFGMTTSVFYQYTLSSIAGT